MGNFDTRLIAALAVYGIGFILWFIGLASPDKDEIQPMAPFLPPQTPRSNGSLTHHERIGLSLHEKISIGAFLIKTVINVATSPLLVCVLFFFVRLVSLLACSLGY